MAEEKKNTNEVKKVNAGNEAEYSSVLHYADCSEVNMIDSMDDEGYINIDPSKMKKQSMEGFGDYQNIVDYIVKITRQIWKEKDIGLIYDTYSYVFKFIGD